MNDDSTVSAESQATTSAASVKSQAASRDDAVDDHSKNYLTEAEITRFLKASKLGRHGVRDHAMMLLCYRHGLRVSELIGLRLSDVDLESGRLYVHRLKGSLSTHQPLDGDELRLIRAWLRVRSLHAQAGLPYLFLSERGPFVRQSVNYLVSEIGKRAGLDHRVNPHQLRHSCGFALANAGYDTRLLQDYLGHRSISHTVRYTRTASARFEGLWRL